MPYGLKSGEFNPPRTAANVHLRNANGQHNFLSQGNNNNTSFESGQGDIQSNKEGNNNKKRAIYEQD